MLGGNKTNYTKAAEDPSVLEQDIFSSVWESKGNFS